MFLSDSIFSCTEISIDGRNMAEITIIIKYDPDLCQEPVWNLGIFSNSEE